LRVLLDLHAAPGSQNACVFHVFVGSFFVVGGWGFVSMLFCIGGCFGAFELLFRRFNFVSRSRCAFYGGLIFSFF
jgi:hypothetical protein